MSLHAVKRVPLGVWAVLIALLPILPRALEALWQFPFGSDGVIGLHDPDSWLRLTLVRDWLQGGSWYDHSYASNAPNDPAVSPWTRPLDVVIAAIAQLQGGELTTRLVRTAIILPLLWMGLAAAALVFTVRRLTTMPHAILLVGVLLLTAPINYNYFSPGNADHHAPLCALFCWVVALMIAHDPRRANGIVPMGLLLSLMLWISPEALFIIAIVYGWFGLQWLAGASLRPLAKLATTLTLGSMAALAIERPLSQWLHYSYDTISIAYVQVLAMLALACWLLTRITSFFWLWRAVAAALLLCAVVAVTSMVDPKFLVGPMADADPYIFSDFLPRVIEAHHAWSESTLKLIGLLVQPLLAFYVALRCATQRHGIIAPGKALTLAYLLLMTGVMYFTQMRWAYYFFPLVPLLLAPFLASWLNPQRSAVSAYWPANRLRRLDDRQLMRRRIPLLLLALVLPSVLILSGAYLEKRYASPVLRCHREVRQMIQNGEIASMGQGKPQTILTATELGPELLFFTHDRIIASYYHREGKGIRAVWEAQATEQPARLQAFVKARKVDAIIICPDSYAPEAAVLHRLRNGELATPPWLKPYKTKAKQSGDTAPAIFLVNRQAR